MQHDVFISYATEDRQRVGVLAQALEAQGLQVWWDRDILAGHQFDRAIEEALDGARCVVVCWSAHSVASEWVKNEAAAGAERNALVPLLLDRVKLPLEFRRRQTVDLSGWSGQADAAGFRDLLRGIQGMLGAGVQAADEVAVPAQPASIAGAAGRPGRRAWIVAAGGSAVAAVGLGYVWLQPRPAGPSPAPEPGSPAPGPAPSPGPARRPIVARLTAGPGAGYAVLTPRGFALAMKHTLQQPGPVELSWRFEGEVRTGLFDAVATDMMRKEVVLLKPRSAAVTATLVVRIAASLQVGDKVERFVSDGNRAPGTVVELRGARTVHDGKGPKRWDDLLVTTRIAAPGDSGAPVLDDSGAIVGLLYGASTTESIALPIEESTVSFPDAF